MTTCRALRALGAEVRPAYADAMEAYNPHAALETTWKWIVACNQFAEKSAPWTLAKDPAMADHLDTVLFHLADTIAQIALLLAPVMPGAMGKLMDQLQLDGATRATLLPDLGNRLLPDGHMVGKPSPIFPRIEAEKPA